MGEWQEWLDLGIRWLHITAGVAWIGASFYFMWLDSHLKPAPDMRKGAAGELWSVHGGGFYHKTKFLVAPEGMPEDLHWFKWESYVTWISGFLLLGLIFYVGADLNLIDQTKADLNRWQAIGIGLGSLAAGWLVYDGLCRSPLGARPGLFGIVWFLLLTAATWALTHAFSDRGAFMHVGAIIGTVMTGNVFLIIIPNQKKVVAQLLSGQAPDPALGKQVIEGRMIIVLQDGAPDQLAEAGQELADRPVLVRVRHPLHTQTDRDMDQEQQHQESGEYP
jgi:uncharacterized membrane protein